MAAGLMVCGLAASPGVEVPAQDVMLKGKVVTLAAALEAKKLGIRVDPEPTANAVVLLGEDGTITPLLSDEASRAFSSTSGCGIALPRFGASGFAGFLTFRSSRSRSKKTAGFRPRSIIAISARSAFGSRRFARVARGRWSCE